MAAYLGSAHTLAAPVAISQPILMTSLTFEGVRFEGRSFNPPLYYGGRGGYFMQSRPFLGIEAEFIHLKVYSNPVQQAHVTGVHKGARVDSELPLGEIVQRYSISHGVNLVLFNIALRHGMWRIADAPNGRLILTGRVGAGPTLPHTESTVDGRQQEQYEVGRLAGQVAGGAELDLWKGLYILGEYKFTRTRQHGKISSGTAESLLRTHHVVFGLSVHF